VRILWHSIAPCTQGRVMQAAATVDRLADLLAGARLALILGSLHSIIWTPPAEVNRALPGFLRVVVPTERFAARPAPEAAGRAFGVAALRMFTWWGARRSNPEPAD
jgi:hypothetical protein